MIIFIAPREGQNAWEKYCPSPVVCVLFISDIFHTYRCPHDFLQVIFRSCFADNAALTYKGSTRWHDASLDTGAWEARLTRPVCLLKPADSNTELKSKLKCHARARCPRIQCGQLISRLAACSERGRTRTEQHSLRGRRRPVWWPLRRDRDGSNDLVNYLTAAKFRSIQLVLTLAIKLPEAADGPRQEVFICRL